MRVVMVASECEPFAKTGGLADVVDALSRALGRLGHEVEVFLPRYRGVEPPPGSERLTIAVPRGQDPAAGGEQEGDLATVDVLSGPAQGYRIRLVDHPFDFDRPDLYVLDGRDYPDNGARFTLLGRVALETLRAEGRPPAVIHGHDWQACPALLLQRHRYPGEPTVGVVATVLTCHNLAYHGWVPRARAWQLELPESVGAPDGVDLLREGIRSADLVNTVSPTYAEQSRTPEYGAGLDDVLSALGDRYLGILNGIDTDLWDPARDSAIAAPFSAADLAGKRACKADLCRRHALDPGLAEWGERGAPLFGMVGRLDPQKGFDLLAGAAERLVAAGARLVVLGTGSHELLASLLGLAGRAPDRVAVIDRFDRDEARRIYAGCDLFLMPSRFEPSGQGQMIALRYGALPLVRRTGGLAGTVVDADADPEHGNGFVFEAPDPDELLDASRRAIAAYRDEPRWRSLVERGMAIDWSWERPARRYVAAYERAIRLRSTSPTASLGSAGAASGT
jgi:starch synthase